MTETLRGPALQDEPEPGSEPSSTPSPRAQPRPDHRIKIVRGSPPHLWIKWGSAAVLAAIVLYIPYYFQPFRVFLFTTAMVYSIAILGLNLVTGYSGQISLAQSAFFGVGAYTSAILISHGHWPYLATMPVAAAVTFAIGFLFGIPALRLRGHVLALVTLALAVVAVPFIKRFHSLTGGSQGIPVRTFQPPASLNLAIDQWNYYLVLVVTVVMFVLARNIVKGRVGRALVSLRDNEVAAETLGVWGAFHKTTAFALSAMYAGVSGVLFLFIVKLITPESFTVVLAIAFLSSMVVGGAATISGAIFGGLFYVYIPVLVDAVKIGGHKIDKTWSGFVYGGVLIFVMFVMPTGFVGLLRRLRDLVVRFETPRVGSHSTTKELEHIVTAPTGAPEYAGVPDEGAWSTTHEGGK